MLTREFNGETFRKSSFSGANDGEDGGGQDCVYLPGSLNAVGDSKSDAVLNVPVGAGLCHLVALSR